MITIEVDNKKIKVNKGTNLLQACLDNGIYIPNLCYIKDIDNSFSSCRMCFVEIQGQDKPVASCTVRVTKPLKVKTDTLQVRQLQKSAMRLLLSTHDVDCKNCFANKKCDLQNIAKFLKIGLKHKNIEKVLNKPEKEDDHPFLVYYPNRCILCAKCITMCGKEHDQSILTFAKRGFNTVISFYGTKDQSHDYCKNCSACIDICPVGALRKKLQ